MKPRRKWMILLTLTDSPSDEEDYYSERAIQAILNATLSAQIEGLAFSKMKIQALPERARSPIREGTQTVEKRLKNEEFDRKLVDSLKKSLDMPSADSDN